MRRPLYFLTGILLSALAHAHWLPHDELPAWARRGAVQWGHGGNIDGRIKWTRGGFGLDVPNVKLILYCGNTVQQTVAYLDAEARQLGESAGLKRQPYICSKTIWWQRDFKTAPQLEQALVLKPDGSRVLLYGNPQRYGGCYSSPIWLEYVKSQIGPMMNDGLGRVHSLFFDNASDYDCYCPLCRAGFRQFTQEKFGVTMDLSEPQAHPNFAYAKRWFNAEQAVAFFRALREHLHTFDPQATIAPNIHIQPAWSPYLVSHGATDMLFIESGFSMPPEESGVINYKTGLADTHGMVVGQMCGLSEVLRRERALKLDANNEAGILESFYYPEEHKLAMAEALACDATYVQSFALREQKISVSDEPYQVAIREALHQYAGFWKAHPEIYKLAQPGARVAVLHGIMAQLCDYREAWRGHQAVCDALGRAGIPYEVINEEDLQSALLRSYRLIIAPHARMLSREQAAALGDFVKQGGRLVQFGELAQCDLLNNRYPPEQLPEIGRLAVGDPVTLGKGQAWRLPDNPRELAAADFATKLERFARPLPCRVTTTSPRVFANLLRNADGKALTLHLVNSDFRYDRPASTDLGDDDGVFEARTFLADTRWRVRKVLEVADPAAVAGYDLRFLATTCGLASDRFSLVIAVNGQDVATIPGSQLNDSTWKQVALPPGLLQKTNEVVFRATGAPNGHPDWVAFKLDTNATTGRSFWSSDEGKTWTTADLSPDSGVQTGEFAVRLGPHVDPNRVATVADFAGKLRVIPAQNLTVRLPVSGKAPVATLLSPEEGKQTLKPTLEGKVAVYRVPRVAIYAVLVLPGL